MREEKTKKQVKQSDIEAVNRDNKVRPRVNFTNILCMAFSYESFERNFFVLAVKVKLFIGTRILAQMQL